MDYTVHRILQARILEWVSFPFSMESSQTSFEPRYPIFKADSLPAKPQQKPKNTGVGLPDPGIEPGSPALQADSLPNEL